MHAAVPLQRNSIVFLAMLLITAAVVACSGSSTKSGSYEEVCAACGARWNVDLKTGGDEIEVTITITNTGELGPLDVRGEQVEAVLFSDEGKDAWLADYSEARAEGRLRTDDYPRVRLAPTRDTVLPARIEPMASWTGTFIARELRDSPSAVMISFQSYFAPERPGSPTAWTSRDARRPFINMGDEVQVAAIPTQTPKAGPRQVTILSTVEPETATQPVRYRFEVNPWIDRVERVTVTPPLPGSDAQGTVTNYTLTRLGGRSVLEVRVPSALPAQQLTLTVQLAGGQTVTAEFTHTP